MNFINIYGIAAIVIIMTPNVIYAVRFKDAENLCKNRFVNIAEQIGRYGSFFLMCFNIGLLEYETSDTMFTIWLIGSAAITAAYCVIWIFYLKQQTPTAALLLALLPSVLFIATGILRLHILQIIFGAVFAPSHIYITLINSRKDKQ